MFKYQSFSIYNQRAKFRIKREFSPHNKGLLVFPRVACHPGKLTNHNLTLTVDDPPNIKNSKKGNPCYLRMMTLPLLATKWA